MRTKVVRLKNRQSMYFKLDVPRSSRTISTIDCCLTLFRFDNNRRVPMICVKRIGLHQLGNVYISFISWQADTSAVLYTSWEASTCSDCLQTRKLDSSTESEDVVDSKQSSGKPLKLTEHTTNRVIQRSNLIHIRYSYEKWHSCNSDSIGCQPVPHIVVSLTLRHELIIDKRKLVKEDQKLCTLVFKTITKYSYVYMKHSILRLQTHNFKN